MKSKVCDNEWEVNFREQNEPTHFWLPLKRSTRECFRESPPRILPLSWISLIFHQPHDHLQYPAKEMTRGPRVDQVAKELHPGQGLHLRLLVPPLRLHPLLLVPTDSWTSSLHCFSTTWIFVSSFPRQTVDFSLPRHRASILKSLVNTAENTAGESVRDFQASHSQPQILHLYIASRCHTL